MWRKLFGSCVPNRKRRMERNGLLDLPNELLLLIAEAMDSDHRRRLSNTCRQMFYLLRSQRQRGRYCSMRQANIEIREHGSYHIILVNSQKGLPRVFLSFVVHSSKYPAPQDDVNRILKNDGIVTKPIYWMAPDKIADMTPWIVGEALKYFMVDKLECLTNIGNFKLFLAWNLWRLHPRCHYVILNDSCNLSHYERIYEDLLRMCVRIFPSYPRANGATNNFSELYVCDRRNDAIPRGAYEASTRRLTEKIARMCAEARTGNEEMKVAIQEKITDFGDHRELHVKVEIENDDPLREPPTFRTFPKWTIRRMCAKSEAFRELYDKIMAENCLKNSISTAVLNHRSEVLRQV